MIKRVTFRHKWLPYALLAPQLLITLVFFIWPASQALYQSVQRQDAFGLRTQLLAVSQVWAAPPALALPVADKDAPEAIAPRGLVTMRA